ncbi:hypothetical protein [Burkholderia ubonensis]|uniref:hypothetical protein n=1 Tax=Burkholderia ubonensis TaxID=101571 RepID=UPI0007578A38|nr:hypothetical protein [Burkholderia ubonensis]KWK74113.1 hypothetical protein WM15_32160 [Burkholderia ubonensis]
MKDWKSLVAVLAGVAAVIVISIFGATSAGTQPYKADYMATWMQAIGSIAAILGAIWVSRDERRHARQLRDEDQQRARRRLTTDVLAIAADTVSFLERAQGIQSRKQPGEVGYNETELSDILERIAVARAADSGMKRWSQLSVLRIQLLRGVEILRVTSVRTICTGGGLHECCNTAKHIYKNLLVEQGTQQWDE